MARTRRGLGRAPVEETPHGTCNARATKMVPARWRSALGVLDLEPMAKALRGELARRVARQAERLGDRRTEERIAERVQHQRQGAFRDVVRLIPHRELRDQATDRLEARARGI